VCFKTNNKLLICWCIQLYYDVDRDYLEEYKASKAKQQRQQNRVKRRRSSGSSSNPSTGAARKRQATPAPAQAGGDGDAGGDAGDSDDPDGDVDDRSNAQLDEDSKMFVKQGLAAVCPREPSGRFKKREQFDWATGWSAFIRAVTTKLAQRPAYAGWEFDALAREVQKFAHQ
jgi:hypothetical protein